MARQLSLTPGYRSIHDWVERQLGSPSVCENCNDSSKRCYDWANLSGEYRRDISDWARLCRPCHSRFDGRGSPAYCKRGHYMSKENVYHHPTGGNLCRECRKLTRKEGT